jgi:Fe-S-cluster containining protein
MSSMVPVNLRSFRLKVKRYKKKMRSFLTRLEKNAPKNLDEWTIEADKEVWKETDCLSCANCCKTMSPTYTTTDIRRISAHLSMTPSAFKAAYLYIDNDGDWLNVKRPCQFLDLHTNMCNIYEVRPADCAGFPHLTKKKATHYMPTHSQNVAYCPATYKMVEKMMVMVTLNGHKLYNTIKK